MRVLRVGNESCYFCSYHFVNGIFVTADDALADRLLLNSAVEEIKIEKEVKKPEKRAKNGSK